MSLITVMVCKWCPLARSLFCPLVHGWSYVGVGEVVAAHDSGESIVVGEHESDSHLVLLGVLVGDDASCASMSALVVVIVHEDEGFLRRTHTPARVVDTSKVAEILNALRDLHAVTEFRHQTWVDRGTVPGECLRRRILPSP